MKTQIYSKETPNPVGPYSQAVKAGNFIFVSGQLGIDPVTGELAQDIASQTERAIKNIEAILKVAGASLQDIVRVTVYLKDMDDFGEMNKVYEKYFGEIAPARVAVAVESLPKDARIEMDAIAYIEK